MAWIRIGEDIKRTRIYREINATAGKGDHSNAARFAILIQIFMATANGATWLDAGEIAADFGCTLKQASIVWDACIKHNVLTQAAEGYSADQWLRAQGMLGSAKEAREARHTAPTLAPVYDAEPAQIDVSQIIKQRFSYQ